MAELESVSLSEGGAGCQDLPQSARRITAYHHTVHYSLNRQAAWHASVRSAAQRGFSLGGCTFD